MFGRNSGRRTTKESIPYKRVYDDGIIETEGGTFSKAYSFGDVNFETASPEEQKRIFFAFEELLNGLEEDTTMQVVIHNRKIESKKSLLEKFMYRPLRDSLNTQRNHMNKLILERIASGKNGLKQEKQIVYSIKSDDTLRAKTILDGFDGRVDTAIKKISGSLSADPLSASDRLRSLFLIYNQDGEGMFENVKAKDGTLMFSLSAMYKQHQTTKDIIAPSGFDFTPRNYFNIGNTYGRSMFLSRTSPELGTDFLQKLANINTSSLLSITYEPIPQRKILKMVKNNTAALNEERNLVGDGKFELNNAYEASVDLYKDLVNRKQRCFNVTVAITLFADSKQELENVTRQVLAVSQDAQAPIRTLFARQEDGLNTCLPLCRNYIDERLLLTTESACVFLPFTSLELEQASGINYGTNLMTKNQVFCNRLYFRNYHELVFGGSGSGKSGMAKMEMLQVLMRSKNNCVYVIDPKGEYADFARKIGGEVINVAPGTTTFLNPLDMDITPVDGVDPLSTKTDYVLGLVEIMQRGKELSAIEQSIIDRSVRSIYRGYLDHMEMMHEADETIDRDEAALPTLKDLYYSLLSQPEPEARTLANSIEMYATGSLTVFANRTNVDTTKRLVVYDIHMLGSGTKALGLYVCLNELINKCIENRRKDFWTWMYIDEMQYVMKSQIATRYLGTMWAILRAMNGVLTGILQNTNDILATAEGKNILGNTNFILAMGLSHTDRMNLKEFLSLSQTEVDLLRDPREGTGLFCAGSLRIPVDNFIDRLRHPELFEIINTRGDVA